MKKIHKGIVAAIVCSLLLVGGYVWLGEDDLTLSVAPVADEPVMTDSVRIVAFGDSLTAGYGLPIDQSYPAVLERALTARGHAVTVINSGVSGETSAGGARRAEFIRSLDPDIVLFGLGGNDALRLLSPEELEKNLDEALGILRTGADAPQVLLLGMRARGNAEQQYRQAFDAVYPRLAEKYALPLVPFLLQGVALDPRYTQADGIHPNAAGYQFIVEQNLVAPVEMLLSQIASHQSRGIAPDEVMGTP